MGIKQILSVFWNSSPHYLPVPMNLKKQGCYIAQRHMHMAETIEIQDLSEELIVKWSVFETSKIKFSSLKMKSKVNI